MKKSLFLLLISLFGVLSSNAQSNINGQLIALKPLTVDSSKAIVGTSDTLDIILTFKQDIIPIGVTFTDTLGNTITYTYSDSAVFVAYPFYGTAVVGDANKRAQAMLSITSAAGIKRWEIANKIPAQTFTNKYALTLGLRRFLKTNKITLAQLRKNILVVGMVAP